MIEWMVPLAAAAVAQAPVSEASARYAEAELNRLAADYADDPFLIDVTFGVEVDGQTWTVTAARPQGGGTGRVTVTSGAPSASTWVDVMDGDAFRRIVEGRISILTASARARSSDRTMVNPRLVNGMTFRDETASNRYRSVLAHFWATGVPEAVPFGFDGSATVHGAQMSVLHYDAGFRSAWWGIRPGQRVNADPADQSNPFPSMFIILRGGSAMARLGGREMPLRDQTMILIPAGMTHEFWNPGDESAEGFLIMYGEGA